MSDFLIKKTEEANIRLGLKKEAWLNAKRKLAELDTNGNLKRLAETFGQADQNGRKRLHITQIEIDGEVYVEPTRRIN